MPKKKTLADELAELVNPAPKHEVNPEDDGFGDGPALLDDVEDADLGLSGGRSAGKERGKRILGDIEMDESYRGKRTSRAALFGDEDAGESSESSELEESESEAGPSSDEEESGGSDDEYDEDGDAIENGNKLGSSKGGPAARRRREARRKESDGGDESSSGRDEDSFDGSSVEEEEEESEKGTGDEEMDRYAEEDGQGQGGMAEALRERVRKEQEKGRAVKAQKDLYERALGIRILLQRVLSGANRLPRPPTVALLEEAAPDAASAMRGLAEEARETLGCLVELQDALAAQQPKLGAAGRKRKAWDGGADGDELWEELESRWTVFAPFRDESVDRWHRKAVQGGGAESMRAINRSVSEQVARQMAEEGSVARSRLPAAASRGAIGEPKGEGGEQEAGERTVAGVGEEGRDEETYDDGEFYRTLLKEFLESGAGRTAEGAGVMEVEKRHKVVDRRASKGRKIRYQVMEKLVGFMAPVPMEEMALQSQLFSNLFGKRAAQRS